MAQLKHDGEIHIAVFASRMAKKGKNQTLQWSDFAERLSTTVKTQETMQEYMKMGKDEQDRIKDVGAYVGGWLHPRPGVWLRGRSLPHAQAHPGETPAPARPPPPSAGVGGGI